MQPWPNMFWRRGIMLRSEILDGFSVWSSSVCCHSSWLMVILWSVTQASASDAAFSPSGEFFASGGADEQVMEACVHLLSCGLFMVSLCFPGSRVEDQLWYCRLYCRYTICNMCVTCASDCLSKCLYGLILPAKFWLVNWCSVNFKVFTTLHDSNQIMGTGH